MASPERKISGAESRRTPSVEARLAGLEEEAVRLRAEVAALQDEIRWLTDVEDEDDRGVERGWLTRGWVRASMLMGVVALVAFVSVPYLLHLFDTTPALRVSPATWAPKATASEYVPAPVRVRASEIPPPAYVPRRSTAPPRGESR